MHPILVKTFGGLSRQYYFRQFFFGLIFPCMMIFAAVNSGHSIPVSGLSFAIVSTIFYPYSRFVYESVVGFIMGNNVFFVNAFFMLFVKFMTMALCWTMAIVIAPLGLAYLYFHHSRAV